MTKNILNIVFILFFALFVFQTAFSQNKKIIFPYLIQCENATDKNDCSRRALHNYILQQMKDPKVLFDNGIEGKIITQFAITAMGKVTDTYCIKDLGGGACEEGIRLLRSMEKNGLKWQAGTINGIPKKFVVPNYPFFFDKKPNSAPVPPPFNMIAKEKVRTIKIKKRRKTTNIPKRKQEQPLVKSIPKKIPVKENTTIYSEVDQVPVFPGCQNGGPFRDSLKSNDCTLMALNNYVAKLLKYPRRAFLGGVEGIVIIQYVIEKDGTLSNIKCIKDIGAGCGATAVELFEQMNIYNIRWKPAQIQQKKVRVQQQYIVRFDISQEKARRSQRNN